MEEDETVRRAESADWIMVTNIWGGQYIKDVHTEGGARGIKTRQFPSPRPTGNFYQSVCFNQALSIPKRCFTTISLSHNNLRLIIKTYN